MTIFSVRQSINKLYLLYLILFVYFFITRYNIFPSFSHLLIQLIIFFLSVVVFNITMRSCKVSTIVWSVFLFHVTSAFLMRMMFIMVYDEYLGYEPVDAEFYRDIGYDFENLGYFPMYIWLYINGFFIDDFGYPTIILIFTRLFGVDIGMQILILANGFIVALGSYYLYKLSMRFVNKDFSKGVAILWGTMPYAIYQTASGLKENFFVFCVIMSIYHLYQYRERSSFFKLLCFIFWSSTLLFFRLAVALMPIIAYSIDKILSFRFVRYNIKKSIFFLTIICYASFQMITSYMYQIRGYDYEDQLLRVEQKSETSGSLGSVGYLLAGLIGPFPNFVASDYDKQQYITLYSFTPLIKIFVSFFFYYILFLILQKKYTDLIPAVIFCLLNIVLCVSTLYSFHDRYQWPHYPILFLISACGYYEYRCSKSRINFYSIYMCAAILIIVLFNFRG